MKSQMFAAIGVLIIASVLMTGLASTINAQSNMTGGNMTGQNATSSNLTQATRQQNTTNATSSQTAGPGPMGTLTQSDFEELTDNLNSAREALKDNDPAGAVGDLGSAETEVRVFMTQIGGEDSAGGQQLGQVLNHINAAQDSSGNNDTLTAFQAINTADTELLKVTQKLPTDGDGGE
jgi:hypothetical protein